MGGSVELLKTLYGDLWEKKNRFYVNVLWEIEKASYEKKILFQKKKILTSYFKLFEQETLIK